MIDNTNEIIELLENGENAELECKKSTDKLSTDIWETYSAFANTKGGSMLIGVKEKKNKFYVLNVENPKKIIKEFFDCLNNHEKVSRNIISENDVQTVEIEGKKIIIINVPRADRKQKPIYINGNPMTGTYKRNYEGDYRCTEEEINRMFAEKSDMAQDNKILEDFTLEDINYESLHSYRKRFVFARGSAHPWNDLSDEDFLYQLGCTSKKDKNHLTLAGLLMFGSEREITNILPKYFLDYREKDVSMINERWSHRIISSDGTWTGNLYDFYFKIINRLTSDLEVPFKLKNSIRNDNTPIHNAIREALTNTLVHTDFLESGSILVEKENNTFKFTNPGTLRISKERALKGGESDPRNPILHKMFSLIGLGERAGTGLITIQTVWKNQYWQKPELYEIVQPDKVKLVLKTISLIPVSITNFLKNCLDDSTYQGLSKNEILALAIAAQYNNVTNIKLQDYAEISSYESNKVLSQLMAKRLLESDGNGRGMKYMLSNVFKEDTALPNQISIDMKNNSGSIAINPGSTALNSGSIDVNSGSNSEIYEISKRAREKKRLERSEMENIIIEMCNIRNITLNEFSYYLDRDAAWIRKDYLKKLVRENKIKLLYPDVINHPAQAYCKSKT